MKLWVWVVIILAIILAIVIGIAVVRNKNKKKQISSVAPEVDYSNQLMRVYNKLDPKDTETIQTFWDSVRPKDGESFDKKFGV